MPQNRVSSGGPSATALLLVTWTALSLAIAVNNGAYRERAMLTVLAGLAVLLVAVAAQRSGRLTGESDLGAAGAAVGASLAASLAYELGLYGSGSALTLSRSLSIVAALLALGTCTLPARWRTPAALSSALAATGAIVAMVVASPRPLIDVWFVLTEGSKRMVGGDNLFTGCWPGNTDPTTDCLYPYGPLTTVVQTPFRLVLGDVRYSYVVCLLLVAAVLWRLAGPRLGPALAVLVLISPKSTFLVEQAWTEPLLLVGIAVMVLAVLSGRPVVAIVAFGFALACKQHAVLLVPLAACWPAFGWRRTALSVAGAGAFTLPWFLVDPPAFLEDVLFHIDIPARLDSLSLSAAALDNGYTLPLGLSLLLTVGVIAAAAALLPRTATGFVIACALVQYVFDLLNKQSFFNQWWFVTGLLLLAAATACREARVEDEVRPPALAP